MKDADEVRLAGACRSYNRKVPSNQTSEIKLTCDSRSGSDDAHRERVAVLVRSVDDSHIGRSH